MRQYVSKPSAPPRVPFTLDGVQFTTRGNVSMLDLSAMARLAVAGADTSDPRSVAAFDDFFRAALSGMVTKTREDGSTEQVYDESEYTRFANHVRRHQTDPETLFAIMEDITEDVTAGAFPTERPNDSSVGPSETPPTLRVFSESGPSAPVVLTPERAEELRRTVARMQAELNQHRPMTG